MIRSRCGRHEITLNHPDDAVFFCDVERKALRGMVLSLAGMSQCVLLDVDRRAGLLVVAGRKSPEGKEAMRNCHPWLKEE